MTPRYLMDPSADRWFKPRSFLKELGIGMMAAAGLYCLGLLAWAVML